MEKIVLSSYSNLKNKTASPLLINPTGSISKDTFLKEEHPCFQKANEASIVVDLKQKRITSQNGLHSLLGVSFRSNHIDDFIESIHSEDKNLLEHIFKSYLNYCGKHLLFPQNSSLNFTHLIKLENDKWIKLLTQINVLEVHDCCIEKILVRLTNISFLCTEERVNWTLQADPEQRLNFKKYVAKKYENLFTTREMEIIHQIHLGLSNVKIGEKLFISKQTVATHRKRILKKSQCHSANELIIFCKERGII